MKLSEKWKKLEKPDDVAPQELAQYVKDRINAGADSASHDNAQDYIEGADWSGCVYKSQADRALDRLVEISGFEEFDALRSQFISSSAPGMNRDSIQLIKSSIETLCFLIEEKNLARTNSFLNAVQSATFDACAAGAANNMQIILSEIQHSDYYDKDKFIRAKLAEQIRSISFPGNETHATEEVMYLLQRDYHTNPNRSDMYARFPDDPQTSDLYASHRRFKASFDHLVASPEGAYEYINLIKSIELMNLPNGGEAAEFNFYDQEIADRPDDPKLMPSADLQKVTMLAATLGITTDSLISTFETYDKDQKFTFQENFQEIIAAAIAHKLMLEGLVEKQFLSIQRSESKKKTTSYILSDPQDFKRLMQEANSEKILSELIATKGGRLKKLLSDNRAELADFLTLRQLEEIDAITQPAKPGDQIYKLEKSELITKEDVVIALPEVWFMKRDDRFETILNIKPFQDFTINNKSVKDFFTNLSVVSLAGTFDSAQAIIDSLNIMITPERYQEDLKDYDLETRLKIISDQGQALSSLQNTYSLKKLVAMSPNQILKTASLMRKLNSGYMTTKEAQDLLNQGADIHVQSMIGRTIMHFAATNGYNEIVEMVLKQSPESISIQDADGRTPLHLAAIEGRNEIVEMILKQSPESISIQDKNGHTPLHFAATKGHNEIMEMILKQSPESISIQNKSGDTPLHLAADRGHNEIVEMILKQWPESIRIQNKNGDTPLHFAAAKGRNEIVEIILKQSPESISIQDQYGKTPLHLAALYGENEVVEMILKQ